MKTLLLACILLCGCPSPVAYVTRHAIEVAKPAPPPEPELVEEWTSELVSIWRTSPCAEISTQDVLGGLARAFREGLPVRLYWRFPPKSTGRLIQANERTAYQHELSHALIDGYRLAPWGDDPHHRLMCRCALPVGPEVCKRLGVSVP
jgi:hypothetical protein